MRERTVGFEGHDGSRNAPDAVWMNDVGLASNIDAGPTSFQSDAGQWREDVVARRPDPDGRRYPDDLILAPHPRRL